MDNTLSDLRNNCKTLQQLCMKKINDLNTFSSDAVDIIEDLLDVNPDIVISDIYPPLKDEFEEMEGYYESDVANGILEEISETLEDLQCQSTLPEILDCLENIKKLCSDIIYEHQYKYRKENEATKKHKKDKQEKKEQVLLLIQQGISKEEIASRLSVSRKTIYNYLNEVKANEKL